MTHTHQAMFLASAPAFLTTHLIMIHDRK
uniref:Uncharacterized protein n=1 Tax=Arundo donax TaxID=35708 RepID=A0A0A9A3X0_ARUDO